jgi:branched-chain amino acid aminotransferase
MASQLIYLDGKWVSKEKATLSVFDHGVLYGDGVFEGIRAYQGHVFRLNKHLERLYESAKKIELTIPIPQTEMEQVVKEALQKNNLSDAYIRLLVTRGIGDLGLDIRQCPTPSIVVIADKLALYPARYYENGLESAIVSVRRNISEALDPTIKSMNYLNMILAKIEANKKGVPEAIMLNHQGYVAECSGDNVFYVKGDSVITPPVSAGLLEGITRGAVMELIGNKTAYKLKEELFRASDIMEADEVFFTGTAAEVIPVTKIDGQAIGDGKPGKITQELMRLFKELTRKEALATRP